MDIDRGQITRRRFIQTAGVTAAALMSGQVRQTTAAPPTTTPSTMPPPQRSFRFVHLTDIHVQPELDAETGFRQCIRRVNELDPRPDFILTGGDLVMDVLDVSSVRAIELFGIYKSACSESEIPIHNCLGNHDVFGWGRRSLSHHMLYGKKMAQEWLGMDKTTYSFEHKGWHFCVVDDIQSSPDSAYEGGISEEDLHWLDQDLNAAGDKPKVICVHIPIISVAVYRKLDAGGAGPIPVSRGTMCRNVGKILEVIRKHKVNLVLSGHMHENETITYDRTTFIEDGAVSGAWWKGAHNGNPEGFGVFDVRADGTFEHKYQTYGWEAEPG